MVVQKQESREKKKTREGAYRRAIHEMEEKPTESGILEGDEEGRANAALGQLR